VRGLLALLAALSLSGCAFANANERVADQITRAVIANDVSPVMERFAPQIEGELTRVRVAELSDELAAQGTYQGLRQTFDSWCPQGALCFDVQFEKAPFHEIMKLAKDGKVRYWWIRAAHKQS
jgi:hypothetical protein